MKTSNRTPTLSPIKLLFIWLALAFIDGAHAQLPNNVKAISREKLARARYFLGNGAHCGFSIAASAQPGFEKLLEEGARVFAEPVLPGDEESKVPNGVPSPEEVWMAALPYTWRQLNTTPARLADKLHLPRRYLTEELLRHGLAEDFGDGDSFEEYQRLFYLIRLNAIPHRLLIGDIFADPPVRHDAEQVYAPQRKIYFVDDLFWGAELTFAEFEMLEIEFLRSHSPEHLTITVRVEELGRLLESPVMGRLTSLELRLRGYLDRRDPELEAVIDRLGAYRTFHNLKRLSLYDESHAHVTAAQILPFFQSATQLEHLELKNIRINEAELMPSLDQLTSLELTSVLPSMLRTNNVYVEAWKLDPSSVRQDFVAFFSKVNPGLNSLFWFEGSNTGSLMAGLIGDALNNLPEMSALEHLHLNTHAPDFRQWRRLADRPDLWKNLETFQLTSTQWPLPAPRVNAVSSINRVLRQAPKLKDLALATPLRDSEVDQVFRGVKTQYERLMLSTARLDDNGLRKLAVMPAARKANFLGLPAARFNEAAVRWIYAHNHALREILLGRRHPGTGSYDNLETLPAEQRKAAELLHFYGIEIKWTTLLENQ